MTNRIRRSFKIRSMDSEYSEFDATSTNTQNQGNRVPVNRLNLKSNETPVRGNIATQILKRLTWRNRDLSAMYDIEQVELVPLNFSTVKAATNNFSEYNKVGQGGFGPVYKGTLPNGQEIAVKRLSRSSLHREQEFKNEVVLVTKLQHRNIVRLHGFCLEGEERILVYEFMTNKSLDFFLFDPEKQVLLDWTTRCKIIGGIARGILYLHEDSWLRLVHGDIKASNILLDDDMNPKIADFGLSKLLAKDQTEGSDDRICGTFGYLAPEYLMTGQFSVKSDVYSFGVLIFEIISGKKYSSFYKTDNAADLVSSVWIHWRDGTPLELLDPALKDTYYSRIEVERCIQIGLLCVQRDPESRPTTATIGLMLNSYSVTLPLPQEPDYYLHQVGAEILSDESKSNWVPFPSDDISITEVYPR